MQKDYKKLMLIAPLPPPYGGIAFITRALYAAGLEKSFNLIHINTSKGTSRENIGIITFSDIWLSFRTVARVFSALIHNRNISYALILTSNNTALYRVSIYIFLLRLFHVQVLTNLHGTRFFSERGIIIKKLHSYIIKRSSYILSPTQADLEGLQQNFNQCNKFRLFYNSTYITSRNTAHNSDNVFFILIGIGRLSQAKGAFDLIQVVIELIHENHPVRLLWIGSGAFEKDDLLANDLISKAGTQAINQIELLKNIDDMAKFELLNQSDLFILPTYTDNLPISILEAMAMKLPVISTHVGAIPEVIIEKENGWLVEPGDLHALKKTILMVLHNKSILEEIGKKNEMKYLTQFSTSNRLSELIDIIHEQTK